MNLRDVTPGYLTPRMVAVSDDRADWYFGASDSEVRLALVMREGRCVWGNIDSPPLPAHLVPPQAVIDMALEIIRGRIRYAAPTTETEK